MANRIVNSVGALSHLKNNGLALTLKALHHRRLRGTIPFRRRGGSEIMFDLDELDAWLRGEPGDRDRGQVAEVAAISGAV